MIEDTILPAELPDELPDTGADAIMEAVMSITALLNSEHIPPPIGPIAVRAWLKAWESRDLDADETTEAMSALIREEWRKEVAAIKKRTII